MRGLTILISAALLVSACVQPETDNGNDQAEALTAYISPQTRTSLGNGEDGIYDVLWTAGDAIVISDGYLEAVYTTDTDGASEGLFIPKTKIPMDFTVGVIAGYPAGNIFLGAADLNEDIYITIPQVQSYKEGSFDERTMPMISDIAYEPVLNFKNAAGVIRLVVSGEEEVEIKSVTIRSDKMISGELCYNPQQQKYANENPEFGYPDITLECAEGVMAGKEAASFHIVVPHQRYSDMTITVTAEDGRIHAFNLKEGKEIEVARGSIVNIPLKFTKFGTSTEPQIECTTTYTSFKNFGISLSMKNVESYYSGLVEKSVFERELENGDLLASMSFQTLYTAPLSYTGAISSFQEAFRDILIEQGHEYVFWVVPYKEDGNYTVKDIFRMDVTTKAYQPGGTIKLTASDIEADMTGISVTLSTSEKAAIVYNMLFRTDEMDRFADEEEMTRYLLSGSAYFFERDSDVVIRKFLSPGTSYTLIALAVDKQGNYGDVFIQEVSTVAIPRNESVIDIEMDLEALKKDQTLRWEITGGSAQEYRYIFTPTERYLWTGTLEASVTKAAETLFLDPGLYYITRTTENTAQVSMENGKEYVFVILAVDESGSSSAASHWFFTY